MKKVVLNCEYVQGFLKGGHFELELNDEDFEKFKSLSKEKQCEWVREDGDIIIDSFRVEDYMTENHCDFIDV